MVNPLYRATTILAVAFLAPGLLAAPQEARRSYGIFEASTDIGKTQEGATHFDPASGTYRVTGGGGDMWAAKDDFHFTYLRLSGDATLTADVSFPDGSPEHLAKGVLIVRQSLDPGAPYADIAMHADGHVTLQYRATSGAQTQDITAPEHHATRLRLERKGNLFTASTGSGDGKLIPFSSSTVRLEGPVYVGIGVCAHNAEGLVTATFSNVMLDAIPHPQAAAERHKP